MWERLGAPKDKIVVGMATYGNAFIQLKLNGYESKFTHFLEYSVQALLNI